jgi:hypothetical protein
MTVQVFVTAAFFVALYICIKEIKDTLTRNFGTDDGEDEGAG